jgi:hypothetical protein
MRDLHFELTIKISQELTNKNYNLRQLHQHALQLRMWEIFCSPHLGRVMKTIAAFTVAKCMSLEHGGGGQCVSRHISERQLPAAQR